MRPFKKILIANRGEIAVRILRTCRELGIETVCVHSQADENSLHVKLADESVCIGPARSSQSYLNIPAILSAAEITGADAIHPGLGFLSESKEFSEVCEKWGLRFIGPSRSIIAKMGDKILSKKIAEEALVPVLKPIAVKGRALSQIKEEVSALGFPVLIKASAGGGGRGMQKITSLGELGAAIDRLAAEAKAGFGDETLFIEKYVQNPRHIEIQILGDRHGNVIHLGERDCTIQRRFQKILEESPSPVLSSELRTEMENAALKLARHVGYDSVGTVEFLYDQVEKKFYFMEMNTRIQVEHPVTEERTNVDLIQQQIDVASGKELSLRQEDIKFFGHTFEFRINAEDPFRGLPSPGRILHYHRPAGIGVRVDDFVYSGHSVSPFYDSLIAKVIVSAEGRDACINRSRRVLKETFIEGIQTNRELHCRILESRAFQENKYGTDFLDTFLS